MKQRILAAGILSFATFFPAFSQPLPTQAESLVKKITQDQVVVTESFEAINGLTGLVVEGKSDASEKTILFADLNAPKPVLFIGNLIGENGFNYTQDYLTRYVSNPKAALAYQEIPALAYFTDGDEQAPHKIYSIIEPNCSACHALYQELKPYIDNGTLAVRWIPVSFLKSDSTGKAAAILLGKDDKARANLLAKNEQSFDVSTESGGVAPVLNNGDALNAMAFLRVNKNTAFFEKHRFMVTPILLFKQKENTPTFLAGFSKGDALKKLIESSNNHW